MARRLVLLRWLLYGLCAAAFLLLQSWLLDHIVIWGVHPFIVPFLAVIPATLEKPKEALIYTFVLGLFCDVVCPGLFSPFYCFLYPLVAWLSSLISRRTVMPGFFCSVIVGNIALAGTDLINSLLLLFRQTATFGGVLLFSAKEIFLSLLMIPLTHYLFTRIHRLVNTF